MTTTNFIDNNPTTPIVAAWLNDVDETVYAAIGAGGVAPTTPANVRANIGLTATTGAALVGATASTNNSGATVQAQLTNVGSATGATNVGFTQAGTGAVARTAQDKMRDVVSVFDFMTTSQIADVKANTSLIDVTSAIQTALNSSAATKSNLYFPSGTYLCSSTLVLPTYLSAGRSVNVSLIGNDYNSTILSMTGAAYLFSSVSGGDNLNISNIQINTTTGGGITIGGDVGGLFLDNFFMNGCASTFSAINQTAGVIYTCNIQNSRFWNSSGYFGAVITMAGSGINIAIRDSFISQQKRDGDIITINNTKNFISDNVQYEGTNITSTSQTFVRFTGNCFNAKFINTYLEGTWDTGITTNLNVIRHIELGEIYAWNSTTSAKPNCVILDLSATTIGKYHVENIEYTNASSTSGTGYIVNDPLNLATIDNFHNGSVGNQASRVLSQNIYKESLRETGSIGFFAVAATITKTIQLPSISGEYVLSINIISQDQNHQTNAKYRVIWNTGHTNNWSVTDILGTIKSVGSVPPTGLAVSVNTSGLVTVTATSAQNGTYSYSFYWMRLQSF